MIAMAIGLEAIYQAAPAWKAAWILGEMVAVKTIGYIMVTLVPKCCSSEICSFSVLPHHWK